MRIRADLHVHTIASGHAFSTVEEIARAASLRGIRAVGIADHGPALPGGPHLFHFLALRFLPPTLHGVRILRGVEANLVDARGAIDLPPDVAERLDYVMVGFHEGCGLKAGREAKNTHTLIQAMRHRNVRVVTHPGNPAFPVDVAAVTQAARDLGVAIELNNASFTHARRGSGETCRVFATRVAAEGGLVSIASDAHVATQVGEVTEALQLATAAGIQPEQIVNRTAEGVLRFLGVPDSA